MSGRSRGARGRVAAARRRWGTIGEGCVCVDVNSLRLAIIVDIALFAGFDRSEPHREHHAERADQHETHADKAALQVLDGDLVADRFLDEGIELVLRRRRHGKGGGEEGSPGVGCEDAFGAGAKRGGVGTRELGLRKVKRLGDAGEGRMRGGMREHVCLSPLRHQHVPPEPPPTPPRSRTTPYKAAPNGGCPNNSGKHTCSIFPSLSASIWSSALPRRLFESRLRLSMCMVYTPFALSSWTS